MHSVLLAITVAVLGTPALGQNPGDKPPLPAGAWNTDLINADTLKQLPAHSVTNNTKWEAGVLPTACWNDPYFYEPRLLWADFEVRNIRYSDCDKGSWAICRHKNAAESWSEITQTLSRVPIGMRQNLANIVVIPAAKLSGKGITAYASLIQGVPYQVYSPGYLKVGVALHESSHSMDSYALRDVVVSLGYPAGTDYSKTKNFQGAWQKDSNVVTAYSTTNWAENFAEVGQYLGVPNIVIPGGVGSGKYGDGWKKVANQMGNYQARLESLIFPSSSGQCTFKVPTTSAVRYGSERRVPEHPGDVIMHEPLSV